MKVLHVINNLEMGGAEKLLALTLPKLRTSIDVDLLLINGNQTIIYDQLSKEFTGNIFILSKYSIYNPINIFKIFIYLKRYKIIHVHLFPSLYIVAVAKFLFRLKNIYIFSEHSTENKRLKNYVLNKIDRLIYKCYDHIVCITPAVRDVVRSKLRISDNRCSVIYNGIDVESIQNALPYKRSELNLGNDKLLIQVSRFHKQKDHLTLINALKLLPNNIKLLLVGDGETKIHYIDYCKKNNLLNRVYFLNQRSDIPELIKMADIVIQSSHSEGFGLAALEGMAACKPVIASNVEGLNNVVGEYGLLFDKGDSKYLADLVNELFNDKEYYNYISNRCLLRSKSFSLKNMVDSTLALYYSLN